MRVNISDIAKTHGASLEITFNEKMPDLNSLVEGYIFECPVTFQGRVENFSGILKLKGRLKTCYSAKCFRCLGDIEASLDIDVQEDFVEAGEQKNDESYIFEGNFIELDKAFTDNILLNLPMRQLCAPDCKGYCPQCGCNRNEKSCECREETINPQMEVLKNFFNN